MFGSVFKELYGLLNKRFVLNALFPSALLGLGLVVVWESTGAGLGPGVARLTGLAGTIQAAIAVLALAAVLLAAILLASQTSTLLSWMEGESGPFSWGWATSGRGWWEGRRQGEDTSDPLFGIPRAGDVASTALGTLGFANAEYVRRNYGAELAVVWPRLAPLVPAPLTTTIDAAESAMEQLISFSATMILFGFSAGVAAAIHRASLLVCFALPVGFVLLGYILYRALLSAAENWSGLIRTAFDLYRFALLDALHLAQPRTSAEEKALWKRLSRVLRSQEPDRSLGFVAKKA